MQDFQNHVVLVTGATRGIGRATALAFAQQGAKVVVHYQQNEFEARKTLEQLPGDGHLLCRADIRQPEQVAQLINAVLDQLGRLDILVNNAARVLAHPWPETSYADWQKAWQETLETNLLGVANLCYCAAQPMRAQGWGSIVNVSSRGAFRGEPTQPAYGASKAGLNALTQSLAQAFGPANIQVNAVAPGFTETERVDAILHGERGEAIRQQSPLNRVATPEEVAHAIVFLASRKSIFTTGAILDVNGASYLR